MGTTEENIEWLKQYVDKNKSSSLAGAGASFDAAREMKAKRQQDIEFKHLQTKLPNQVQWTKLERKAVANQGQYQQSLQTLADRSRMPLNPQSAKMLTQGIITAYRQGAPYNPNSPLWQAPNVMSPEAFNVINYHAMKELGREYQTPEEAAKNFGLDFKDMAQYREYATQQYTRKLRAGEGEKAIAIIDGKAGPSMTLFDGVSSRQLADVIPDSYEKLLLQNADLDRTALREVAEALSSVTQADVEALYSDREAHKRTYLMKNAYQLKGPAEARHIAIPLTETPGGAKVLNVALFREGTYKRYFYGLVKRAGHTQRSILEEPEKLERIRKQARHQANVATEQLLQDSKGPVWDPDPEGELAAFKEYRGVRGNIRGVLEIMASVMTLGLDETFIYNDLPDKIITSWLATTLPARRIAGKVRAEGQDIEEAIRPGGLVEFFGEGPTTRALDYGFRVAPTEFIGAAFYLALNEHLDEAREKGDDSVYGSPGKGLLSSVFTSEIPIKMLKKLGSDELIDAVAGNMDNSGELWMDAGPALFGEAGRAHPYIARALMAAPLFAVLILEPTPEFLAGPGLRGVRKGGAAVAKGLRAKGIRLLSDYEYIEAGAEVLLKAEQEILRRLETEELTVAQVKDIIAKAKAQDKTGAADAVYAEASTQRAMSMGTSVISESDLGKQLQHWKVIAQVAKAEAKKLKKAKAKLKAKGKPLKEALKEDEALFSTVVKAHTATIKAQSSVVTRAKTIVTNISKALAEINALEGLLGEVTSKLAPGSRAYLKTLKKKGAALQERITEGLDAKQAGYVRKHVFEESLEIRRLIDELHQLDPGDWSKAKGRKLRKDLAAKLQDQLDNALLYKKGILASKLISAQASVVRNLSKLDDSLNSFYDDLVTAGKEPGVGIKEGTKAQRVKAASSTEARLLAAIEKQRASVLVHKEKVAANKAELKLRKRDKKVAEELSGVDAFKPLFEEIRVIRSAAKALVSTDGQAFMQKYVKALDATPSEAIAKDKPFLEELRGVEAEAFAKLSDQELAEALIEVDAMKKMWREPGSTGALRRSKPFNEGVLKALYENPRALYAYGQDQIKLLMTEHLTFLTMTPRFLPMTISMKVENIAKKFSRVATSLMSDLDLLVRYTRPEDRAGAINTFLTTTEPFEVQTFGLKRKIRNISLVTQPKPLIMKVMDYIANTVAMDEALLKAEKRAGVEGLETIPMNALLRAFVDDSPGSLPIEAEKVNALKDAFLRRYKVASEAGEIPEEAGEMLTFLENLLIGTVEDVKLKPTTGIAELGATAAEETAASLKHARSRNLFTRAIISAAIEEQYIEGITLAIGYKFTENMARAMNGWMRVSARHDSGVAKAIKVDDLVVRISTIRRINKPLNTIVRSIAKEGKKVSGIDVALGGNIPISSVAMKGAPEDPRIAKSRPKKGEGTGDPAGPKLKRSPVLEEVYDLEEPGFALKVIDIVERDGKEFAVVIDPNMGKSAKPIEIELSKLTHREVEYSSLDALDGFLMWGMDFIDGAGVTAFTAKARKARGNYQAMVAHSKATVEIDGKMVEITRMIPRAALVEFHRSFDNLAKELTQTRNESVFTSAIVQRAAKFPSKMLSWWRSHVLFGLVVARPAFFTNQVVGDWAQMWTEIGFWDASALVTLGTLGYIPVIGDSLQKSAIEMTAIAARSGKVPLPSVLGALFNPQLDKILTGLDDVAIHNVGPDGVNMTAKKFLGEFVADGGEENIRTIDFGRWLEDDARRINAQLLKGVTDPLEISRLKEIGRDISMAMELKAREATRRQRMLFYAHMRVNKGLSRADAKKMLDRSLYDWTHSVGRVERNILGNMSVFYTFTKNAYAQIFRSIFEGADITTLEYMKRFAKGETKLQRIKQMSLLSNVLPATLAGETYAAGETVSPEEAYKRALQQQAPRYFDEYPIFTFNSLSPEGRAILERDGMIAQQYAGVFPKLTPVEFMITTTRVVNAIAALGAAGSSAITGSEVVADDALSIVMTELEDMRDPLTSEVLGFFAEKAGIKPDMPSSTYGKRVKEGEVKLLYSLGYGHLLTQDDMGFLRFDPKELSGLLGYGAWQLIGRPAVTETNRLRLLYGIAFPGEEFSLAKVKAIAATEGPARARLMAAAELSGIIRNYFYSGYLNKVYNVKDQEKKWSKLNSETERYLATPIRGKN